MKAYQACFSDHPNSILGNHPLIMLKVIHPSLKGWWCLFLPCRVPEDRSNATDTTRKERSSFSILTLQQRALKCQRPLNSKHLLNVLRFETQINVLSINNFVSEKISSNTNYYYKMFLKLFVPLPSWSSVQMLLLLWLSEQV